MLPRLKHLEWRLALEIRGFQQQRRQRTELMRKHGLPLFVGQAIKSFNNMICVRFFVQNTNTMVLFCNS